MNQCKDCEWCYTEKETYRTPRDEQAYRDVHKCRLDPTPVYVSDDYGCSRFSPIKPSAEEQRKQDEQYL